jgi:hypothetical protein
MLLESPRQIAKHPEQNSMEWINEMFAGMEKDRIAALAKRSGTGMKVIPTGHHEQQSAGTLGAWNALVAAISSDINEFNSHKERSGQTAVRMRQRPSECEVYLPGMHSQRLVLRLDNDDLQVSVHPNFPKQRLTITVELDQDGQHGFWVLGESSKESARLSVQQLSEYLLKPVLCCAAINREI